ncbi:hypothetical protein MUU53_05960 [Rhizobium lemnae]|uniref:Uncharacterized protein n=1 Tax=Rhizobium lemnae TaxID=1214924 RepID=A0ABV8ED68_9HYPH|nr:hypothetical protein [Rhizobium lemnae]MCJ8507457.1 hypothetical protein [Rhizobium lemnae]
MSEWHSIWSSGPTRKVIRFTDIVGTASAQSIPIKDRQIVHRHVLV